MSTEESYKQTKTSIKRGFYRIINILNLYQSPSVDYLKWKFSNLNITYKTYFQRLKLGRKLVETLKTLDVNVLLSFVLLSLLMQSFNI